MFAYQTDKENEKYRRRNSVRSRLPQSLAGVKSSIGASALLMLMLFVTKQLFHILLVSGWIQRRSNLPTHGITCSSQGIIAQMGVALGRGAVCVTQERADDWQACTTRNGDTGKAVPKVMKSNIFQARPRPNILPDFW